MKEQLKTYIRSGATEEEKIELFRDICRSANKERLDYFDIFSKEFEVKELLSQKSEAKIREYVKGKIKRKVVDSQTLNFSFKNNIFHDEPCFQLKKGCRFEWQTSYTTYNNNDESRIIMLKIIVFEKKEFKWHKLSGPLEGKIQVTSKPGDWDYKINLMSGRNRYHYYLVKELINDYASRHLKWIYPDKNEIYTAEEFYEKFKKEIDNSLVI